MQTFLENYPVLFSVFLLGFSASGHCVAMCGGLLSVLNLNAGNFDLKMNLVFHCGRLLAYSLLGLGFGFGIQLISAQLLVDLGFWLRIFSACLMVLVAFYIIGLSNLLKRLDSFATPLWKSIYPLLERLLPMDSYPKALLLGVLWIFLPCGLVYSALVLSMTTANAFWAALSMFVFGVATSPALVLTNSLLGQLSSARSFRYFSAFLLLVFAFWVLVATLGLFGGGSGHHLHFAN